jgi:hypothetical protein
VPPLLQEARTSGPLVFQLYQGSAATDNSSILVVVLIGLGFTAGLILGRWWALLACVGVGVCIGVSEELEVPGWFLGLAYAGLSGLGIAGGVLLRRYFAEPS